MTLTTTSGAVRADGYRIHYLTAGSGPPVVLLAGFPQTADAWRPVIPALAERHTVYAVDLPGLGHSDKPAGGHDVRTAATRLHTALQGVGLDRYALVGHDVGAWVAAPYAGLYPEEVTKLVLMEAAIPGITATGDLESSGGWELWGHFLFHALADIPETLLVGNEHAYVKWFITRQLADPTSIGEDDIARYAAAYATPGAWRSALGYYRAFREDVEITRKILVDPLRMPVLSVDQEGSPIPLAQHLPPFALDHRGVVIPDSGHFLAEEQPERLASALLSFLGA
jgi:pimeloyl-ACP methyl ester carboxylesterase